jgi:hypothetical protein
MKVHATTRTDAIMTAMAAGTPRIAQDRGLSAVDRSVIARNLPAVDRLRQCRCSSVAWTPTCDRATKAASAEALIDGADQHVLLLVAPSPNEPLLLEAVNRLPKRSFV